MRPAVDAAALAAEVPVAADLVFPFEANAIDATIAQRLHTSQARRPGTYDAYVFGFLFAVLHAPIVTASR